MNDEIEGKIEEASRRKKSWAPPWLCIGPFVAHDFFCSWCAKK